MLYKNIAGNVFLMSAALSAGMPAAALLQGILRQLVSHEHIDILPDARCPCLIYPYACLIQPAECPAADTADNDRVDFVVIKRLDRIARPVRMMLVIVRNGRERISRHVNNYERGR
jgi:hypothetical protein